MFPNLAATYSPTQVAVLLAATRLAGMTCPGLHSLLSSMALSFDEEIASTRILGWSVQRVEPRYHLVDIDIKAQGVRGVVGAFIRPGPASQKTFASLKEMVNKDEFSGQTAIVIGGGRGLGELIAKLLTLGGARATITYHQGSVDAERVVADARSAGHIMHATSFNVLAKDNPSAPATELGFTHLYYCATPHIRASATGHFDYDQFDRFLDYYVLGLAKTIERLRRHIATTACCWFPSSTFLDGDAPDFAEYVAAKACGEAMCRQFAKSHAPLRFMFDRLPPMPTDQTQSLYGQPKADAVAIVLEALRRANV
jgi:hypothetical protein